MLIWNVTPVSDMTWCVASPVSLWTYVHALILMTIYKHWWSKAEQTQPDVEMLHQLKQLPAASQDILHMTLLQLLWPAVNLLAAPSAYMYGMLQGHASLRLCVKYMVNWWAALAGAWLSNGCCVGCWARAAQRCQDPCASQDQLLWGQSPCWHHHNLIAVCNCALLYSFVQVWNNADHHSRPFCSTVLCSLLTGPYFIQAAVFPLSACTNSSYVAAGITIW